MAAEKLQGSKPEEQEGVARKVLLGCIYGKLVSLCGNWSPKQAVKEWVERIWSAPLVLFHIHSLSRIESLQLARETDKCMPRWERATLAILNIQDGGRVTQAMCSFWGPYGTLPLMEKEKSKSFWHFLSPKWCTQPKCLMGSPLKWESLTIPFILRYGT